MNEGKVKIAAGLVPLMNWLFKAGVLSIGGSMDAVHVSEDFFRETFPVYEVKERNSDEYRFELSYKYGDILFFAVSNEGR